MDHSFSGLLRLNGVAYTLVSESDGKGFALTSTGGTCDGWQWSRRRTKRAVADVGDGLPSYYRDYVQDGVRRYVELALIADHSVVSPIPSWDLLGYITTHSRVQYKKYGEDEKRVHSRMESIANVVNSLYSPLNIRVTLVWADIWEEKDAIEVSTEADKTLSNFLVYRKSVLDEHPHDNAHLLT